MDMKVSSTVGYERRHSPLLQEADEESFVTAALAALRPQPPNFRGIVELNRGPLDTGATELLPLSPRQVEQRRDNGALVVDVRTVSGYLAGGMTSWRLEGRDVRRVERIDVTDLRERMQGDPDVQILDVRESDEWRDGHIPGAAHTAYHDLDALPPELDPERAIAVICASGQRSAVAAGLVQRLGADTVMHVAGGGVPAWRRAGYPIEP
jgi:hydroxyacylglutathione hydrolase